MKGSVVPKRLQKSSCYGFEKGCLNYRYLTRIYLLLSQINCTHSPRYGEVQRTDWAVNSHIHSAELTGKQSCSFVRNVGL